MDPKFRQTAGDAGYGMAPVGNAAEAGRDFSMIRPGKAADVEPLRQIYNHAVEHSTATFDLEPRTAEEMTAWFQTHQGIHRLLVWEQDGAPVAYATLSPYRQRKAFDATVELSVYVREDCRGQGIGGKLMAELLRQAREDPRIHTVVSVITSENVGSIRLHERLGFTFCGRIREAGYKFGRWLGVDHYQIMVDSRQDVAGARKEAKKPNGS